MNRTHLFELIIQIHERTDLKLLSVSYTSAGLEAILKDDYDSQNYHIAIWPTKNEKI